jgi:exodeoxyribonuclease VII large subunit
MRDAQQRLDLARDAMSRQIAQRIENGRRGLAQIARALQSRSPARELLMRRNRVTEVQRLLAAAPPRLIEIARHRFSRIEAMLRLLGPDATLRRGYSITTDEHGNVIRAVAAVRPKMKIRTRVTDGEFDSTTSG